MAHRDEMGMSAPTSAHGGKPEEICSVCDLSILTRCGHRVVSRLFQLSQSAAHFNSWMSGPSRSLALLRASCSADEAFGVVHGG